MKIGVILANPDFCDGCKFIKAGGGPYAGEYAVECSLLNLNLKRLEYHIVRLRECIEDNK